jgi:hypothetical protein
MLETNANIRKAGLTRPYAGQNTPTDTSPALAALWLLDLTDRVYGVLPKGADFDKIMGILGVETTTEHPFRVLLDKSPDVESNAWQFGFYHWGDWPGHEQFLFDCALIEEIDARVAAGLWKPVSPKTYRMKSFTNADAEFAGLSRGDMHRW